MYEEFFGLRRRPFSPMPDATCFVPFEGAQGALDALAVNCERGQGIGVLTGDAGLGKSLLGLRLVLELQPTFATAFLGHSAYATRRALLQAILFELHRPFSRMAEQELRLELTAALQELRAEKSGLVLVIDEAHRLTAPLLDEVRLLTLQAEAGEPLTRVVLIGNRDLEERLADAELAEFNRRISCQVDLDPLTQVESIEYLQAQIEWAEGNVAETITDDALAFVARAADGIPRCLNHLIDHALLLAFVLEQRPVTLENVRQALDDLKQLPLQWNDPSNGREIYRGITSQPMMEDSAVELWPSHATTDSSPSVSPDVWDDAAFGAGSAAIEIGGELESEELPALKTGSSDNEHPAGSLTCLKDGWQVAHRDLLSVEEILADVAELTTAVGSVNTGHHSLESPVESRMLGQVFGACETEFGAPSPESFAVEEFAQDEQDSVFDEALEAADLDDDADQWPAMNTYDEEPVAPVWNLPASDSRNVATWNASDDSDFEEEPVVDRYVRLETIRNDGVVWNHHAAHERIPAQRTLAKASRLVMSAANEIREDQDIAEPTSDWSNAADETGIVESYSRSRTTTNWAAPLNDREVNQKKLVSELREVTLQSEKLDELEEQVAADVLDLYLDVQQSRAKARTALDDDQSRLVENQSVPREPEELEPAHETKPDTIQRAYGRLFSELRRRR